MSDERVRRPPMERQGPHRDFANLLGGAGRRPGAEPSAAGAVPGADPAQAGSQFVEQGVRAAYDVIDTYLRQGQRVAQRLGGLSYGPAQLGGNVSEMQARWMRLSTDLMAGWFDLLGLFAESMMPPNGAPPPGPAAGMPPAGTGTGIPPAPQPPTAAPALAPEPSLPVAYEIASSRPAQVYVEFLPGRATDQLASHGLQSLKPAPPVPVAFRANAARGGIVVSVQVPDSQPAGLYTAALLDARTGACVGTLSLELAG